MKRLNQFFGSILVSLILASCVSIPVEQVNHRISAWKGQNIAELIKYWGLPSNQRMMGGKQYAEWINKSSEPGNAAISIGSGHRSSHSGIGIGLTLFDLGGHDDACSRLVTYDATGLVEDINWQGTSNFCFEITPDLTKIKQNKAIIQN